MFSSMSNMLPKPTIGEITNAVDVGIPVRVHSEIRELVRLNSLGVTTSSTSSSNLSMKKDKLEKLMKLDGLEAAYRIADILVFNAAANRA